jgi:hypothetical protein
MSIDKKELQAAMLELMSDREFNREFTCDCVRRSLKLFIEEPKLVGKIIADSINYIAGVDPEQMVSAVLQMTDTALDNIKWDDVEGSMDRWLSLKAKVGLKIKFMAIAGRMHGVVESAKESSKKIRKGLGFQFEPRPEMDAGVTIIAVDDPKAAELKRRQDAWDDQMRREADMNDEYFIHWVADTIDTIL